jgi:hypothetical protein
VPEGHFLQAGDGCMLGIGLDYTVTNTVGSSGVTVTVTGAAGLYDGVEVTKVGK